MKRLVVVADNALVVEAVRSGLQSSNSFELVGYVSARTASLQTITQASPDVVLVDDMEESEAILRLIGELHAADESLAIFVLLVQLRVEWLDRALAAGARGAISKAIHPVALGTLLRETVNGNIVHSRAMIAAPDESPGELTLADHSLTPRELEILKLVASGATNVEIGRKLWVTEQTVKFHVSNLYRKLDVTNRTEACHYAHVHGLLGPEPPSLRAAL